MILLKILEKIFPCVDKETKHVYFDHCWHADNRRLPMSIQKSCKKTRNKFNNFLNTRTCCRCGKKEDIINK